MERKAADQLHASILSAGDPGADMFARLAASDDQS